MIFNGAVAIGFLAAEWVILVTSLAPRIFTTAGPAMATCAGVAQQAKTLPPPRTYVETCPYDGASGKLAVDAPR
jgi:hypothetical protein